MLEHAVAPGLVVQGAKGRGMWWSQVGGCMMFYWLRPPMSTAINCVVPCKHYWGGLHWWQGLLGSLCPVARGQDNSSGQRDWLQTHHVVVGDKASKGLGQLGVHGSYRGPGCWCSLPHL